MNKEFIINYYGNTYRETIELDDLEFSTYKRVIEQAGGTFRFSRYLYELKELKDINYIMYDNDAEPLDFFDTYKDAYAMRLWMTL